MIGVEDNGNPLGLNMEETEKSLATIYILAKNLKADLDILQVKKGHSGFITEARVRIEEIQKIKSDIKVILLGNEGAGKSTLLGVLISGKPDNGNGLARQYVFRHFHERSLGQTSSVT